MNFKAAQEIIKNYNEEMSASRKREDDFIFQREAAIARGFLLGYAAHEQKARPVMWAVDKLLDILIGGLNYGQGKTPRDKAIKRLEKEIQSYQIDGENKK